MIINTGFMKAVPKKKKKWELKKLQAMHHEILRLKLQGLKSKDIAKVLGISPVTVGNTDNSTLGREKLRLMQAAKDCSSIDFAQSVKNLLPHVIEVCEGILNPGVGEEDIDKRLQLDAARFVAKDLAGVAAPTRVDARHQHLHAHMTAEDIEKMKKRAYEQAAAAGMLVE